MNKPERMPKEVYDAIIRYSKRHDANPVEMLSPDNLKWDGIMGCYFFYRNGMFHGVEIDGHIHT